MKSDSEGDVTILIHTVLQAYGFSPVCMRRCLRKAPFDGNDLSHKSQGNGFSPVCVRIWMLKIKDILL